MVAPMKSRQYIDTRGRTVMTAVDIPQVGETFTISGFYKPDRRWWKRALHWVLRRPPPMTQELQQWLVKEVR